MNEWQNLVPILVLTGVVGYWGAAIRNELRKLNEK